MKEEDFNKEQWTADEEAFRLWLKDNEGKLVKQFVNECFRDKFEEYCLDIWNKDKRGDVLSSKQNE